MLPRRRFHPDDHLSIGIALEHSHALRCGEMIFIGGQADIDAQTHTAMGNIERVLAEFGLDLSNLVKINTFYAGQNGQADLLENASVRAGYYRAPGPASTGIPFSNLAYKDMLIEIDCIAMV